MSDNASKKKARDRQYNRKKLLVYLYYFYELNQPAYGTRMKHPEDVGEGDPENAPIGPLSGWALSRVDDEAAWLSYRTLNAAVDHLYKRSFPEYSRLIPAYFGHYLLEPNPNLPEIWKAEAAEGSVGDRIAVAQHDKALEVMLDYVEEELPKLGLKRLKVKLPQPVKGVVRRKQRRRRMAAMDILCEEWDKSERKYGEGPKSRAEAIKAASLATGYSPKEMRAIARDLEGDIPAPVQERAS